MNDPDLLCPDEKGNRVRVIVDWKKYKKGEGSKGCMPRYFHSFGKFIASEILGTKPNLYYTVLLLSAF